MSRHDRDTIAIKILHIIPTFTRHASISYIYKSKNSHRCTLFRIWSRFERIMFTDKLFKNMKIHRLALNYFFYQLQCATGVTIFQLDKQFLNKQEIMMQGRDLHKHANDQ